MNLPEGISEGRKRLVVEYQAAVAGPLIRFLRTLAGQGWAVQRHPYCNKQDRVWRASVFREADEWSGVGVVESPPGN